MTSGAGGGDGGVAGAVSGICGRPLWRPGLTVSGTGVASPVRWVVVVKYPGGRWCGVFTSPGKVLAVRAALSAKGLDPDIYRLPTLDVCHGYPDVPEESIERDGRSATAKLN